MLSLYHPGRLATDLDVVNAALYLASDEAAFLNGVALSVDGGLTACCAGSEAAAWRDLLEVADCVL